MSYVEYMLAVASFAAAPFAGKYVRERAQLATAKAIARAFR